VIVSILQSDSVYCHVPVLFPRSNLMIGIAVAANNMEKPLQASLVYDHRHIYGAEMAQLADALSGLLKS
jgi:hypothetical protein